MHTPLLRWQRRRQKKATRKKNQISFIRHGGVVSLLSFDYMFFFIHSIFCEFRFIWLPLAWTLNVCVCVRCAMEECSREFSARENRISTRNLYEIKTFGVWTRRKPKMCGRKTAHTHIKALDNEPKQWGMSANNRHTKWNAVSERENAKKKNLKKNEFRRSSFGNKGRINQK